jgi:uncharacterized SAM-binding protein YcdF (DUF218 family)
VKTLRLAALLAAVLLLVFLFRSAGTALIVDDPLHKARAVVVLGGGVPFRAMEAADVYKQGYAPEVWLTRGDEERPEDQALDRIGVPHPTEYGLSAQVLERFGVPKSAIHILPGSTVNTAAEVRAIASALKPDDRVIIVSSKAHTRRVRVIWRSLVGARPEAAVRYARADRANIDQWWQSTGTFMAVSREWAGILNATLGFPVATR